MRILFVGDVVGKPGRQVLRERLAGLMAQEDIDLCVVNGENAAGGVGITEEIAQEFFSWGVDLVTMGNHVWDKREVYAFIEREPRLIRPLNYPPGAPGQGVALVTARDGSTVAVVNLSGRVFSTVHFDCPFRTGAAAVEGLRQHTGVILVDLHAEATSEKVAMGWFLDSKVTAVLGTHTHVQTADERILPGGTAFITDVGMTGPRDSVIGIRVDLVLDRFLHQRPVSFEVAKGPRQLSAVVLDVDAVTGRARQIRRILQRGEG